MMKKLSLVLCLLVWGCDKNTPELVLTIEYKYYMVSHVDFDGTEAVSPIIQVGESFFSKPSTWGARVSDEFLQTPITTFNVGCVKFETFICYDGVVGQPVNTATTARFGIRITPDECVDYENTSFTILLDEVTGNNSANITSPFQYRLNDTIFLTEIEDQGEPGTDIIWGDGHLRTGPSAIVWRTQIRVGTTTSNIIQTTINFNANDLITADQQCSSYALPVEWILVQAAKEGNRHYIHWVVNEFNVVKFIVFGSVDGIGWDEVAYVKSNCIHPKCIRNPYYHEIVFGDH